MKLTTAGVLLGLLLTGCGGGTEPASSENLAQDGVAKIAETKAPKVVKPKNPLDTDDNRTACTAARREVGERADVFTAVGEGTALPADAAKAAKELQKDTGNYASFSTGAIQSNLSALSDAYGRMRVSLTVGDIEQLTVAAAAQNKALGELGTLCESIGA